MRPGAGRSRRPPLDRVNALLSFLYAVLGHDCRSAVESVGFDPQVGFLHADRPGRASLALDLMEELRPVLADRLALTLISRGQLTARDFAIDEGGAVSLTDDGRKAVLVAWQDRKKRDLRHPFLGETMPMGLVPHVQALLLSRHLRGDLDGYPPFVWIADADVGDIRCEHAERRRAPPLAQGSPSMPGSRPACAKFRI